jgi:hypothetical protein
LGAPRDGALLPVLADERAEAPMVDEPVVQAVGATEKAGGGQQQERGRGQQGQDDAQRSQPDSGQAAGSE